MVLILISFGVFKYLYLPLDLDPNPPLHSIQSPGYHCHCLILLHVLQEYLSMDETEARHIEKFGIVNARTYFALIEKIKSQLQNCENGNKKNGDIKEHCNIFIRQFFHIQVSNGFPQKMMTLPNI